jgi:hypothetical protein
LNNKDNILLSDKEDVKKKKYADIVKENSLISNNNPIIDNKVVINNI